MTAPRPTAAQLARRRGKAAELYRQGYRIHQIALALGITNSSASNDVEIMRLRDAFIPPARGKGRSGPPPPDPEPYDWRSAPQPAAPDYERTSPIPRVKGLLDSLKETNARNRMGNSVEAAIQARDRSFFVRSQVDLIDLIRYLEDLLAVITDGNARQEALTPSGRDDLTGAFVPESNSATALPVPGAGIKPARVYSEIWAYMYAGIPVDDDILAMLSGRSRRNGSLTRLRRAAREMAEAYPDGVA